MIGIDSNIIIDVLKDKQDSIRKLSEFSPDEMCTSEVVIYEILCGIFTLRDPETRLKQFKALIDTFAYVFPVDRKASLKSAEIAAKLANVGKMTEHQDALIAGSLVANGCRKFVTKNVKDFKNIGELEVISC